MKTSPGKTTSDSSELPRPGARVWRSQQGFFFPCSCPPAIGGQGVGGQRGRGLSAGRMAVLGVCSCRSMPRANCCHSQEEGGGQGIMTQVSLGWYSLQGLLASWWSPCPGLSPDRRTTPAAQTGARHRLCLLRVSLALLVVSELLGSLWTPGDDSEPGQGLL